MHFLRSEIGFFPPLHFRSDPPVGGGEGRKGREWRRRGGGRSCFTVAALVHHTFDDGVDVPFPCGRRRRDPMEANEDTPVRSLYISIRFDVADFAPPATSRITCTGTLNALARASLSALSSSFYRRGKNDSHF